MRVMKDSGVEWVQRIPSEWETKRLKYIAECNIDVLSENTDEDEQIKYIDIGSVTYEKGIEQIQEFRFSDSPSRARRIIKSGDTIISTVRTYLKAIAYIDQMYDGNICSTGFAVLRAKAECNPKFLYYALCAEWFISMVEAYSTGISYPAITSTALCSLPVIMPQSREQQRIASFLDTKCAQIDAIIEKQQQVIEKLKTYKQSVITEAVTKGLNPTVPMKDSGVEWIGKIPGHWKIGTVHFGTQKIGSGKTPKGGAEVYSDSGILFLRSQNIYDTGLQLENATYISEEIDEEMSTTRVYPNDVLLNITGGSIGRACIYPDGMEHANVNQHVCIIRVIPEVFIPQYMHYFWISAAGQNSINIYQTGANREGMNFDQIGKTRIPYLKLEEQKQIVAYLDRHCFSIGNAISKKLSTIDKLVDYKKSLIYEAVTGKMEA